MSLAAELWTANADLAAEALAHPFVAGVGDGTLPRAVFAGYVAGLGTAADGVPAADPDAVFTEVVAAETAFWTMAMEAA